MKKTLSILLLITASITASIYAFGAESFSLTPNATQLQGQTTNSTAGTVKQLAQDLGVVRVYLTAQGYASTTNGASADAFVLKLSSASGSGPGTTNNFDTASLSTLKLVISNSNLTSATVTVSGTMDLTGAKYLRVGQIENTAIGPVSNIVINVGYPLYSH